MGIRAQIGKRKNYVELWAQADQNFSFPPDDDTLLEVTKWVDENGLGKRMAYNGWQLNDQSGITAFILRWSTE